MKGFVNVVNVSWNVSEVFNGSSATSMVVMPKKRIPEQMEIRGAKVHNLKNVDVDIPLHQIVGIAGISGSGKSQTVVTLNDNDGALSGSLRWSWGGVRKFSGVRSGNITLSQQ